VSQEIHNYASEGIGYLRCGFFGRADHAVRSVANRPKFLPQNAKGAPEKYQRPKKTAAEFSADLM
jgi:hypothetical protein